MTVSCRLGGGGIENGKDGRAGTSVVQQYCCGTETVQEKSSVYWRACCLVGYLLELPWELNTVCCERIHRILSQHTRRGKKCFGIMTRGLFVRFSRGRSSCDSILAHESVHPWPGEAGYPADLIETHILERHEVLDIILFCLGNRRLAIIPQGGNVPG